MTLHEITIKEYKNMLYNELDTSEIDNLISNVLSETKTYNDVILAKYKQLMKLEYSMMIAELKKQKTNQIQNKINIAISELKSMIPVQADEQTDKVSPIETFIDWQINIEKYLGYQLDEAVTTMYKFCMITNKMSTEINEYERSRKSHK